MKVIQEVIEMLLKMLLFILMHTKDVFCTIKGENNISLYIIQKVQYPNNLNSFMLGYIF